MDDATATPRLDEDAERRRLRRLWVALFFPGLGLPLLGAALVLVLFFSDLNGSFLPDAIGGALLSFVMGYGCAQLVWVAPLAIASALWRPTRGLALGVVVGAALVFLLQAACYGLVISSLGSMH